MNVLLGTSITPSMLVSTNAPERLSGQVEWTASTAYPAGSIVTRTSTRRVYRAAFAVPDTVGPPEEDIATNQLPYWIDTGPMNQWAMFDGQVRTQTVGPVGDLVVVLRPGPITSAWLANLANVTSVQVEVKDKPGGVVVYDQTIELGGRQSTGWWAYWYGPFSLAGDAPFNGIPAFRQSEVTITFETGGTASVGMAALGNIENLGCTEWGVDAGFNNYSARNLTSVWGPTQATEGEVTKDIAYRVFVKPEDAPRVDRWAKNAMKRPAVFLPSGKPEFEGIRIFGQAISANLGYPGPNYVPLDITVREFL